MDSKKIKFVKLTENKIKLIKELKKPFITILSDHLIKQGIGKNNQKRQEIVECIYLLVEKIELSEKELKHFLQKTHSFPKFKEGNIWSQINQHFNDDKLVQFCELIANSCPKGLSTSPNAACGKYELLYRILRTLSRQPKKGDILDDGERIEIKGSTGNSGGGIRLFGNLTGVEYCKKTKKIFENSVFKGNSTKAERWKKEVVWEIEKPKFKEHYQEEFSKDIDSAKLLLQEYFKIFDIEISISTIDKLLFPNRKWSWENHFQLLLNKFYEITKKKAGFDSLYIFGDGTNLKIIKDEKDLCKLNYEGDFFRINQDMIVGYYIH